MGGGAAPKSSVGATLLGSLKKPNNWSDLAGDEGGGMGGGVGRWPMEGGLVPCLKPNNWGWGEGVGGLAQEEMGAPESS